MIQKLEPRGLAELRLGPRGSADHQGGGSQGRAAGRHVQRPIRRLTGPSQIGRRETSMDLGAIAGWASVVLGQLVSWPQVLKLRRERGDGVSLASYAIVTVSMTLFFLHAVAIGDVVSVASVPVSMVPNILIATTLLRRRPLRDPATDARRSRRSCPWCGLNKQPRPVDALVGQSTSQLVARMTGTDYPLVRSGEIQRRRRSTNTS